MLTVVGDDNVTAIEQNGSSNNALGVYQSGNATCLVVQTGGMGEAFASPAGVCR